MTTLPSFDAFLRTNDPVRSPSGHELDRLEARILAALDAEDEREKIFSALRMPPWMTGAWRGWVGAAAVCACLAFLVFGFQTGESYRLETASLDAQQVESQVAFNDEALIQDLLPSSFGDYDDDE